MQQILGSDNLAVIKVVGVGGGGTNAVNRMVEAALRVLNLSQLIRIAKHLLLSDAEQNNSYWRKRLLVAWCGC